MKRVRPHIKRATPLVRPAQERVFWVHWHVRLPLLYGGLYCSGMVKAKHYYAELAALQAQMKVAETRFPEYYSNVVVVDWVEPAE